MRTRIIGILSTEDTEDTDRRKLSTELFFCSLRLEILEEIFNEIWPLARNQSSEFRRILDGNKIFNYNLCAPCAPWIKISVQSVCKIKEFNSSFATEGID